MEKHTPPVRGAFTRRLESVPVPCTRETRTQDWPANQNYALTLDSAHHEHPRETGTRVHQPTLNYACMQCGQCKKHQRKCDYKIIHLDPCTDSIVSFTLHNDVVHEPLHDPAQGNREIDDHMLALMLRPSQIHNNRTRQTLSLSIA